MLPGRRNDDESPGRHASLKTASPAVSSDASSQIESLTVFSDGQVRLTLRAPTAHELVIQASTNMDSWEDIGTIKTSEDSAEFRDLNAAQHSHRFYRLKQIY